MAKSKSAPKAMARPKEHLGLAPVVTTNDHMAIAVKWILWIQARAESAKAFVKAQTQAIKAKSDGSLKFKIDDQPVDPDAYLKLLRTAVEKHALKHHADLFSKGAKTYELPMGAVSAASQPAQLIIDEEDKAVDRILKTCDLLPEIQRLKVDFPNAFPFLKITFELDRQAILAAYNKNELDEDDLKAHGMRVEKPKDDKITVKA